MGSSWRRRVKQWDIKGGDGMGQTQAVFECLGGVSNSVHCKVLRALFKTIRMEKMRSVTIFVAKRNSAADSLRE